MNQVLVKTNILILLAYLIGISVVGWVLLVNPNYFQLEYGTNEDAMYVPLLFIVGCIYFLRAIIQAKTLVFTGNAVEVHYTFMPSKKVVLPVSDLMSVVTSGFWPGMKKIIIQASRSGDEVRTHEDIKEAFEDFSKKEAEPPATKMKSFQIYRGKVETDKNTKLKELLNTVRSLTIIGKVPFASKAEVESAVRLLQPYVDANMRETK